MRRLRFTCIALVSLLVSFSFAQDRPPAKEAEIRLLVRADDMGAAQAINEACILTATDGIARSVEIIVPGPWFLDAVRLLKDNPTIDVGVHLTLTSEWERIKWRPLTHAPSLIDADGYFLPMTSQRKDFPPDTGFLQSNFKLDEVERELRAQIELARKHLPRISHVSTHMGVATATPELRAVTEKLANEFTLRMESPHVKRAGRWSGNFLSLEQKEQGLIKLLEDLQPGNWLIVEHPAFDTPEMRNLSHKGYENVAADRAGVTHAFLSPKVRQVIRRRNIKLIGYADLPAN
jgi:hypothetical protein